MKNEIRRRMRGIKRNVGAERLLEVSAGAAALVEGNERYRGAERVMLYYPLWDEVDCRELMDRALAAGKRVILPTVAGDDIVPVEVTRETVWRVGEFGILEPVAERYEGEVDVVVVPGMAFDAEGNRLGRGKGYYDRFLSRHPRAYRIGLCFDFQLIERVPTEPFDWRMNEVVAVPVG